MAASNDDLVVKVKADIRAMQASLRQAAKEAEMAGKNIQTHLGTRVDETMAGIGRAASAASGALVAFSAAAGTFVVRTVASFERLSAQLETVEGSSARAQIAFDRIQAFAANTPFQLDEVVDGFIRLRSRGLDPSSQALLAYGNIAAGMSKSLEQAVEAVADAATGEFERLKEFGIKASKQGEQITFTFQGVTTTVGNSAAEIESYLQRIGTVNFAGSMERQMQTLGGVSSNLGDAIAQLALKIDSETGFTGAIKNAMASATAWINSLADVSRPVAQIEGDIARLQVRLSQLSSTGQQSRIGYVVKEELAALRDELMQARIGSTELADVDRAVIELRDQIVKQTAAVESAKAGIVEGPMRRGQATMSGTVQEYRESLAELDSLNSQLEQAMRRRDQLIAAPAPDSAGKGSGGDGRSKAVVRGPTEADNLASLSKALKAEEALRDEAATAAAEQRASRAEAELQAEAEAHAKRVEQFNEFQQSLLDSESQALVAEQERFNQRLEMLAGFSEAELEALGGYNEAKEQLIQQHEDNVYKIREQGLLSGLSLLKYVKDEEMRSTLDAAALALKTASTYSKKAFEFNKGVGIANALVNTAVGVTKALELPFPLNLAAAATTAAAGFAQVQAIRAAKFGGGGASGSVAGAANPNNTTQAAPQQAGPQVSVNIAPGIYNEADMRRLAEALQQAYKDGAPRP